MYQLGREADRKVGNNKPYEEKEVREGMKRGGSKEIKRERMNDGIQRGK